MENEEIGQIEIREHEIEHILGRTPGKFLRIGITILFVVFLVILTGSAFFSYPDIISAPIRLQTEHAPAPLACKNGGKLAEIWVRNGEMVDAGDIVAVLENAADTRDVLYLAGQLENESWRDVTEIVPDRELRLGDIQNAYAAWKYSRIAYQNFKQLRYHARRIQAMREQREYMQEYLVYGEQQGELLEEELSILDSNYRQSEKLAGQKIISGEELDNVKTVLLQKKYSFAGNKASLANSKVQIAQLEQSMIDLELEYQKQKKELENEVRRAAEVMYAQMKAWEQMYVVRAPEDGLVAFTEFWTTGDYVSAGKTLFTIVPPGTGGIVGQMELPMLKSGKVKQGQRVHVKLDNYPYMEYGILTGEVNHISLVPNVEFYNVEVVFPHGLVSSYGKTIDLLQGMSGSAEIVTEKQSLFQRLLFPLKALIKNNK